MHLHGHLLVFSFGNSLVSACSFTRIISWHSACACATIHSSLHWAKLVFASRRLLVLGPRETACTRADFVRDVRGRLERLYIGKSPQIVAACMSYDSPFDLPWTNEASCVEMRPECPHECFFELTYFIIQSIKKPFSDQLCTFALLSTTYTYNIHQRSDCYNFTYQVSTSISMANIDWIRSACFPLTEYGLSET
jgi:hypothetical protein